MPKLQLLGNFHRVPSFVCVSSPGTRLFASAQAEQVRQIFLLYLEHGAMLPVVQELARRGWVNKRWLTLKNDSLGGNAFTKTSLHKLLTNPIYVGQVKYKTELHSGQQPAIVPAEVWQQTQALLTANGRQPDSRATIPNRDCALLQGLLRCGHCNCAMTPAMTSKKGAKKYRYYVCTSAQSRGWQTCPSKSVPGVEIERFVINQLRGMISNRDLRRADDTLADSTTWDTLSAGEERRMLRQCVSQVIYDGASQTVTVQLHEHIAVEAESLALEDVV